MPPSQGDVAQAEQIAEVTQDDPPAERHDQDRAALKHKADRGSNRAQVVVEAEQGQQDHGDQQFLIGIRLYR